MLTRLHFFKIYFYFTQEPRQAKVRILSRKYLLFCSYMGCSVISTGNESRDGTIGQSAAPSVPEIIHNEALAYIPEQSRRCDGDNDGDGDDADDDADDDVIILEPHLLPVFRATI